ncbi:hypothetical protein [Enterovirga aerilata]|uniref:Nutrient deprivation-induced protein n=1 Tax=Enterovirga aerilata TaxID=2730920 RepID=A0A849IBP2_9HYPH|nr:hypothetical protein [Enterovirga sp. DB1703]NNM73675.1 hypothetical protein [Enterovirga sp. DB1703]
MAEPAQTSRTIAEDSGVAGATLGPQGSNAGTRGGPSGGGSGAGEPGDLKSIASDVASEIASTAKEQGRGLLQAAKGTATSFADQRKDTVAQSIADLAASLRETGNTFEQQPSLKAFVGSAADGLDQLASGLQERSFAEIYGDIESMARRQPLTFGAGAAIAGFLLARFIKSSAEELAEANAARNQAAGARGTGRTRSAGSASPAARV